MLKSAETDGGDVPQQTLLRPGEGLALDAPTRSGFSPSSAVHSAITELIHPIIVLNACTSLVAQPDAQSASNKRAKANRLSVSVRGRCQVKIQSGENIFYLI